MQGKGYQKIEGFRGNALKHCTTVEALAAKEPLHGVVDEARCSSCKICVGGCQYDAIEWSADKAKIALKSAMDAACARRGVQPTQLNWYDLH